MEGLGGDPCRKAGINEGRPTGDLENTSYDLENANKKGLCINYKTREGREVLEQLLASADVFVTNVREKSLKRMGWITIAESGDIPNWRWGRFPVTGSVGQTRICRAMISRRILPGAASWEPCTTKTRPP